MNIRTLAVFVAIVTTIGVASMSMISMGTPVHAACGFHHQFGGNDDCQGNDNTGGTGGNENGGN
jgi:hypothetical protein